MIIEEMELEITPVRIYHRETEFSPAPVGAVS